MSLVDPARLRGRLTLVPIVNEAAFARCHRTAEDGLDLARTCPGNPDGSITQRTAHALTQLIRTADYYIDLHTGGSMFDMVPLAGYMILPDPRLLDAHRRMARAFNLPLVWGTGGKLDGRSLSVARDAKVPAIYAEWGGAATSREEAVRGYVEGCLNVMGELGMIDRPAPASRVRHVVEDDRENAGHLQLHNPAPFPGLFEPAVELHQMIRAGDPLGTVTDTLGERVETVRATNAGLVILVRSFRRVDKGDALAVVVELDRATEGAR
jgi:predicted deacylase